MLFGFLPEDGALCEVVSRDDASKLAEQGSTKWSRWRDANEVFEEDADKRR